jgi:hypothetical protein
MILALLCSLGRAACTTIVSCRGIRLLLTTEGCAIVSGSKHVNIHTFDATHPMGGALFLDVSQAEITDSVFLACSLALDDSWWAHGGAACVKASEFRM